MMWAPGVAENVTHIKIKKKKKNVMKRNRKRI